MVGEQCLYEAPAAQFASGAGVPAGVSVCGVGLASFQQLAGDFPCPAGGFGNPGCGVCGKLPRCVYGAHSASRSCKSVLKVALEYNGNVYTIDRKGFNFTYSRYARAKETRRVTVYVNPENPAESVLSLGVPPETWIVYSLVGAVELVLLGCSGYFFCLYYRKEEATDV